MSDRAHRPGGGAAQFAGTFGQTWSRHYCDDGGGGSDGSDGGGDGGGDGDGEDGSDDGDLTARIIMMTRMVMMV